MTLPDVHPLQADHNQDQALSDVWRELERGMADLQGLPARGPKTRHVIFLEIPNLSIENFGASEGISNVYIEEHGGVW
jgi:hypothetical protein